METPDATERYEKLAELFYKKYGFLPPGKDTVWPRPVSDDEAWRLWTEFVRKSND